jgi:hypothetical protein
VKTTESKQLVVEKAIKFGISNWTEIPNLERNKCHNRLKINKEKKERLVASTRTLS